MTQLNISRPKAFSNKLRSIKVLLNGKEVESLKDGQTKNIELDPGEYKLKAKIDWCGSHEMSFSISEGESRNVIVKGSNPFLSFYYVLFDQNKYLKLEEA